MHKFFLQETTEEIRVELLLYL